VDEPVEDQPDVLVLLPRLLRELRPSSGRELVPVSCEVVCRIHNVVFTLLEWGLETLPHDRGDAVIHDPD